MKQYDNPSLRQWPELCRRPVLAACQLDELVRQIYEDVAKRGDDAVTDYTSRFDGVNLPTIVVTNDQLAEWAANVSPELRQAIDDAWDNIYKFHKSQIQTGRIDEVETQPGVRCWREVRPIENVGLYVPGGTAPLVSTALMLGAPAKIAGCGQIILASPPDSDGQISPAICYAAIKIGASVIRAGGIQAIAAMATGTESVPKVDKLFGPGNQYVTAAKRYAMNVGVAIDMPAGPSEVMVIADNTSNPRFVAADLLSQAEHGPDSQAVLVTTSELLVKKVQDEIDRQLELLPRREIATRALENSFSVVFPRLQTALDFANAYAPEHLILSLRQPNQVTEKVINAGSVFVGEYSPESAGDYASGTNHTLPTNGWARSYGGVSTESFIKKVTFQELTKNGLEGLATTITTLAQAEGLDAHSRAVTIRVDNKEK